MSELKQKAKEELFARLTVHSLANLTTGATVINVIDKTLLKETLTARLKAGWILEADLTDNYDTIVMWERTRDFINTTRQEVRELNDSITSMRDQIASVESGKWASLKPMLPRYREILKRDLEILPVKKQRLSMALIEFKPLKASIKSLKDKFQSYISQLEEE